MMIYIGVHVKWR